MTTQRALGGLGTLYVTRGLPASGKTTWARKWIAGLPEGSIVRLNRDDLRAMVAGTRYVRPVHAVEERITVIQRAPIVALLRAGVDVIVDDTNLRQRYLRELAQIAWGIGAPFEVVDFTDVDVEECIGRDRLRGQNGGRTVGAVVIKEMHDKFLRGKLPLPVPVPAEQPTVKPYVPVPGTQKAIIVDIDGTVALHNDRDPYDTSRYSDDLPNAPVIEQVRMAADAGYWILFTSGRSEEFDVDTVRWLGKHVLTKDMTWDIFMRPTGDTRNDAVVKLELFHKHIRDGFDVRWVLDDRDRVVEAWRSIGLPVMQVAPGNF